MGTAQPSLTQARLKELLHYDPETGVFTWRVTRSPRAEKGDRAGSLHCRGYVHVIIDGRCHKGHRLAWFYLYGVWPTEIDHVNCDKADNRIANLREVTRFQNLQNVKRFSTNRTGFKGVGQHNGKWRARITAGGKPIWLGHFPTAEAAYSAYCDAARQHHGDFARLE